MLPFPQYRKYKNNSSYFAILSSEQLHEKKQLGKHYMFFEVQANHYYEKLQIQDLLNCTAETVEVINADAYEQILI